MQCFFQTNEMVEVSTRNTDTGESVNVSSFYSHIYRAKLNMGLAL